LAAAIASAAPELATTGRLAEQVDQHITSAYLRLELSAALQPHQIATLVTSRCLDPRRAGDWNPQELAGLARDVALHDPVGAAWPLYTLSANWSRLAPREQTVLMPILARALSPVFAKALAGEVAADGGDPPDETSSALASDVAISVLSRGTPEGHRLVRYL